jgi:hypothetical protein
MNVSEQTNDLFILKSGNFKIMGMGLIRIQTIILADFIADHKHVIVVIVPIMVLLQRFGIQT